MVFGLHTLSLNRVAALHQLPSISSPNSHRVINRRLSMVVRSTTADHRRSANYKPTTWSYEFLQSIKVNDINENQRYKDKAVMLEREVRMVLESYIMEEQNSLRVLELIDDIQRLGLAHRFENDVKKALGKFIPIEGCNTMSCNMSLHEVALGFRVLRQNGYFVSQDVFKDLVSDKNNEALLKGCGHEDVRYMLSLRMVMLEARWYIEAYKKKERANMALLELAKLEFNMAQSVLQGYLKVTSRWDIDVVSSMPKYMKLCFLAFYNTINEMGYEALKKYGHNTISYLTKAWVDMLKAFLKEAKWSSKECNPPTFSEYMENAWKSVLGAVILIHTYCLLDDDINFSKEALCHLMKSNEILRWPSIIFRLCNDLATSSEEMARGETVNEISCYMNETGVSEEHAREHMKSLIDEAWKNMN
ncbi:unnamed protein product [Linum tenue]|uniref:Uncharacterized protein n=1 Tax=Linum tenue TaxID=586396 RepID=A0AAV0QZR4_9ROSI|nr:unnamed protein product [Linum tenue]